MRVAGLRVDGAKSGIDYDPRSAGKDAAVGRFLQALRPYVESAYSMGPDLNMEMDELEQIARKTGLPSIKMAIARAQGWDLGYFQERYGVLRQDAGGSPLGRLRAGYGLAAAVLAVLDFLAINRADAAVVVQGFGTLGRGAALSLHRAGIRIGAVADIDRCLIAAPGTGLDIPALLAEGSLAAVTAGRGGTAENPSAVTGLPCDVFVAAAVEDSVPVAAAATMAARAVVPGANLAISPESLAIFQQRGIPVLPDYLAGCGGSLSMEGLFGPAHHPGPQEVLNHVGRKMAETVTRVLEKSRRDGVSPTTAAEEICRDAVVAPASRPYGNP
jgi:glutamate dehydrogenase/leucine dehydrogenase